MQTLTSKLALLPMCAAAAALLLHLAASVPLQQAADKHKDVLAHHRHHRDEVSSETFHRERRTTHAPKHAPPQKMPGDDSVERNMRNMRGHLSPKWVPDGKDAVKAYSDNIRHLKKLVTRINAIIAEDIFNLDNFDDHWRDYTPPSKMPPDYGEPSTTHRPSRRPLTTRPTDRPSTDRPSTDNPSTDNPSTDRPSTDKERLDRHTTKPTPTPTTARRDRHDDIRPIPESNAIPLDLFATDLVQLRHLMSAPDADDDDADLTPPCLGPNCADADSDSDEDLNRLRRQKRSPAELQKEEISLRQRIAAAEGALDRKKRRAPPTCVGPQCASANDKIAPPTCVGPQCAEEALQQQQARMRRAVSNEFPFNRNTCVGPQCAQQQQQRRPSLPSQPNERMPAERMPCFGPECLQARSDRVMAAPPTCVGPSCLQKIMEAPARPPFHEQAHQPMMPALPCSTPDCAAKAEEVRDRITCIGPECKTQFKQHLEKVLHLQPMPIPKASEHDVFDSGDIKALERDAENLLKAIEGRYNEEITKLQIIDKKLHELNVEADRKNAAANAAAHLVHPGQQQPASSAVAAAPKLPAELEKHFDFNKALEERRETEKKLERAMNDREKDDDKTVGIRANNNAHETLSTKTSQQSTKVEEERRRADAFRKRLEEERKKREEEEKRKREEEDKRKREEDAKKLRELEERKRKEGEEKRKREEEDKKKREELQEQKRRDEQMRKMEEIRKEIERRNEEDKKKLEESNKKLEEDDDDENDKKKDEKKMDEKKKEDKKEPEEKSVLRLRSSDSKDSRDSNDKNRLDSSSSKESKAGGQDKAAEEGQTKRLEKEAADVLALPKGGEVLLPGMTRLPATATKAGGSSSSDALLKTGSAGGQSGSSTPTSLLS